MVKRGEYRKAERDFGTRTQQSLLAYTCQPPASEAPRGVVPEGRNESSPAIYCWVRVEKKGPSRRDLMKVAQHEVLGNNAKREVRPVKGR
jgi:hypothetical protein